MIENEMTVSVPLEVVKASEIEPKEVKWLWYPYIPVGKVTLLQGDPGDGKSKLMLSIAALLSKGEPLPFTETEENEPTPAMSPVSGRRPKISAAPSWFSATCLRLTRIRRLKCRKMQKGSMK